MPLCHKHLYDKSPCMGFIMKYKYNLVNIANKTAIITFYNLAFYS